MNLGSAVRLGGKIGLLLAAGYFALLVILFVSGDRINALAAHLIVGGDGTDPSVLESLGFILMYLSYLMAFIGGISLLAFWLGGVLKSRARRESGAA